ncbi:hypothetical protein SDRG_16186 [Saprolegnia diclina VS20]|uniref:START domain-containing protein n=1 Tax=Saprolegnia diclina (strain VS20) TaxID=1156394 RepID=T0R1V6_SAPDV|nr:hypothetical protein SDRG_16186 [Saprolegnia diclina VS20]EQC25968.1 hypothetical protein SDRG_16186 [Saprolegnia diclina VS20]|eukprot:XP_008620607.1 hypothetical protein SDRG_16186 [Saprolegnia diclina VS20]
MFQRPKQELEYLHAKHAKLSHTLGEIQKRLASVPAAARPWQARAIEQATVAHRSMQENLRLRDMVTEQLQVIEALERVLAQPKSMAFLSNDAVWQLAILSSKHRTVHLEKLLDAQCAKREHEWIRYGLHEVRSSCSEMRKVFIETQGSISVVFLMSKHVQLPLRDMEDTLWDHMRTGIHDTSSVLETHHPNLVYLSELVTLPDPLMPKLEARMALRRYIDPGSSSSLFVWRSIVEDELYPFNAAHLIANVKGWALVEATGENATFVQSCIRMHLPERSLHCASIEPANGTLTELLLQSIETNSARASRRMEDAIVALQHDLTSSSS